MRIVLSNKKSDHLLYRGSDCQRQSRSVGKVISLLRNSHVWLAKQARAFPAIMNPTDISNALALQALPRAALRMHNFN